MWWWCLCGVRVIGRPHSAGHWPIMLAVQHTVSTATMHAFLLQPQLPLCITCNPQATGSVAGSRAAATGAGAEPPLLLWVYGWLAHRATSEAWRWQAEVAAAKSTHTGHYDPQAWGEASSRRAEMLCRAYTAAKAADETQRLVERWRDDVGSAL